MESKKNFYKITFLYLFSLVFIAGIVFIIDPYVRYRKPFYSKTVGATGNPALYPGILRNYEYDSLILGTSMAQNFRVKEANEIFNANFINVAQSGASTEDTLRIFNSSNKNNVKNVIMSLDISSFNTAGTNTLKYDYMFNEVSIADYKYLLNMDTFIQILRIATKPNKNPYELGYWANDGYKFSKEEVMKTIPKISKEKKFEIENMKKRYNETIKLMIEENPQIQFYFFFPPYSILMYKTLGVDFEDFIDFKKYVVNELLVFQNVAVYDFQSEKKITHNLDLYKDYTHYSADINTFMLNQFLNTDFKLNDDNYLIKVQELIDQTEEYEFEINPHH